MSDRYSFAEKARRMLTLLMGLHQPQARVLLEPYGLDEAALAEGKRLLFDSIGAYEESGAAIPGARPQAKAHSFATRWFEICRVKLERPYPEIAAQLFRFERGGPSLDAANVMMFLDDLEKLEKSEKPFGMHGPAAREVLRRAGLTDEIVQDLADDLKSGRKGVVPTWTTLSRAEAEAALWDWYLEWSLHARRFIKSAAVLRSLGLGKSGRPRRKPKAAESEEPT